MFYHYLSIISTILIVIGYSTEIYNLCSCIFFNKSYSEKSNNIIWFIWISASGLGCMYGIFIKDYYVSINSGINTGLNATVFLLRTYKFRKQIDRNESNIS